MLKKGLKGEKMKLSELSVEELETMGYDEIAYLILTESGKKEKLMNLFKKVCKVLKLDFESNTDNIGDFFELLSVNKKFIMLDNGFWDLQVNHKTKIIVEEDSSDFDSELEIDDEQNEVVEEENEDIYYEDGDTDTDDGLSDLVIINEDDEETGM